MSELIITFLSAVFFCCAILGVVWAEHWRAKHARLLKRARTIYYAGHWTASSVPAAEQERLWKWLRDEAGFEPGKAPAP